MKLKLEYVDDIDIKFNKSLLFYHINNYHQKDIFNTCWNLILIYNR